MKKEFKILAFYKFVALPHYEEMRLPLLEAMQRFEVLGTIILANEGVNGGLAGSPEALSCFCEVLCAYPEFQDLAFKVSWDSVNPFDKAKVKLRAEIVTLGVDGIDVHQQGGEYVEPEAWNTLIQDPDVVVVDTRNVYEMHAGLFKGAVNPMTRNFRDFPQYVEENLMDKKDKKIAMYCTGGIRCEKSTAYLKGLGFKSVYQLHGGILKYLEVVPPEQSLWEGNCFVFDNRIELDHKLDAVPGAVSTKWD